MPRKSKTVVKEPVVKEPVVKEPIVKEPIVKEQQKRKGRFEKGSIEAREHMSKLRELKKQKRSSTETEGLKSHNATVIVS